jgi:membrane-associated HD superfamily phosphohydrolase
LPQVIRDVIRQHHGTSLIQYFYYKAIEQQREEGVIESIYPNAPRIELSQVNEDTYRYEGPVPQTAESAIIMLADSVEAASRSLKKVTPQSVEELVGKIFLGRLQDGQLDEASLTFRELKKIRESFTFTLLNMLHARVEYPDAPKEEGSGNGNGKRKRGNRGDGERNGESTGNRETTDESEKAGGEEAGHGEASGRGAGAGDS